MPGTNRMKERGNLALHIHHILNQTVLLQNLILIVLRFIAMCWGLEGITTGLGNHGLRRCNVQGQTSRNGLRGKEVMPDEAGL